MENADKKNRKIALFGGSFDPVTNAHISVINQLCERFDKVVVIPCFISPFKLDAKIELAEYRVKMLEKVFEDNEKVKISKWEINRQQASFTYITVQHFKKKYEGDELYFVIGSDALVTLDKWKNADDISANATFYLVKRPNFTIDKKTLESLADKGIRLQQADFSGAVGSSSQARVARAFDLLNDVVPDKVAKYILKKQLYKDFVYITDAYQIFNLKPERIAHTFRAAASAITLAKIYNVNVNSTITAILLHDIGKYTNEDLLKRLNIELPSNLDIMPEPIRHAPISAAIAKQYFKISDNEILKAIENHTTGSARMSKLEMVIYIADAIEDGREYTGIEEIRKLAFVSLEKCMAKALKHSIDYVAKRSDVYYKTLEAYEYYNKEGEKMSNTKTTKKADANEVEAAMPKATKTAKTITAKTTTAKTTATKAAAPKKTAVKKESAAKDTAVKKVATKTTATTKTAAAKKTVKADVKAVIDPTLNAENLAKYIANAIDEKKGKDVSIISLEGKTIIADYFVIATANSSTQVKALSDYVDEKLSKDYKIEPLRRDIDAKWAAVDYNSVIVHIMHEEAREYYQIERLWENGSNIKPIKTED